MEIKKVLLRSDGIKYLIIPKKSDLNAGDSVIITKIEEVKDDRRNERGKTSEELSIS